MSRAAPRRCCICENPDAPIMLADLEKSTTPNKQYYCRHCWDGVLVEFTAAIALAQTRQEAC